MTSTERRYKYLECLDELQSIMASIETYHIEEVPSDVEQQIEKYAEMLLNLVGYED